MPYEIEITPEMKQKFQSEAVESLNLFEKMLLLLEKEPRNMEAVNSAFRAVHSIKGNSDYIGIADINALAHELEDIMDDLRNQTVFAVKPVINVLFKGLDLLRDMNQRIGDAEYKETDLSSIHNEISKIKSLAKDVNKDITENGNQDHEPEGKSVRKPVDIMGVFIRAALQNISRLRGLSDRILADESVENAKGELSRILKTFYNSANYLKLNDLTSVLKDMESETGGAETIDKDMAATLLEQIAKLESLVAGYSQVGTGAGQVDAGASRLDKETPHHKKNREADRIQDNRQSPETGVSEPEESDHFSDLLTREMKINLDYVDSFMNEIAELGIVKNRVTSLFSDAPRDIKTTSWAGELNEAFKSVTRLSDKLQKSVMKLRLLKINTLFERLPRMIRNLAEKSNKEINLKLSGGDIEIDRKVIECLIDPLIHLLRNAVDHGIEPVDERVSRKKPEAGTISISALQEGSHVIIEVMDDGRGLDLEEIRESALRKKIVTKEAVEEMSKEAVFNLIFMPGFSTTATPTPVSGRGVGLDVVNHNMRQIGGNIAFSSEKNKGAGIRLTVPVSLSITEVLLAESMGDVYAFPLSAIVETIRVKQVDLQIINKQPVIPYKGKILPLVYLSEILEAPDRIENDKTVRGGIKICRKGLCLKGPLEKISVIVVMFGRQIKGIAVDRILRKEGVLSRPLAHHLSAIPEFSSAAVLGDGSIALIISPSGLVMSNKHP